MRRMRPSIMAALAVALVAGSGIGVAARDEPAGTPSLVTEEVEPGVERIISDGAGHDLDQGYPTLPYVMEAIAIAPDGTVWLSTTYEVSDEQAGFVEQEVWALGRTETAQEYEDSPFCGAPAGVDEMGRVWGLGRVLGGPVLDDAWYGGLCLDHDGTVTTYLPTTKISAIAWAPDGTLWAVGDHADGHSGLYRITLE